MAKGAAREIFAFSLLEIAWRRKFRILIPAVLLSAAVLLYASTVRDVYRSEALLRAEPLATAHDFVDATGTPHAGRMLNVDEQLRNLQEIVLSEPVLTTVNREFNLYPMENDTLSDNDLAKMRARVLLSLEGGDEVRRTEPRFVSFRVGFEGTDRDQVVRIANRLVELFILRASQDRERRVREVSGFIDAELRPLREKLDDQLAKIRDYKERAVTSLPEQSSTNLRLLETLQTQYLEKSDTIANDEARRAAITQELAELEKQGVLEVSPPKIELSPDQKRLEDLRIQYTEMQARYREDHPELRRLKKEIAELEKSVPPSTGKPRGERSPLYPRYLQLKADLESLNRRAASYRTEQQQLEAQMQTYRSRVETAPQHESALAEMSRDYTATQAEYQDMFAKRQSAQLAERFEKMSREVIFTVVDPARRPLKPYTPTKLRLILLGVVGGLTFGIGLAFLAEHMDTAFEGLDDFQRSSDLPVIVTIPSMTGSLVRGSKKRRALVTINDPKSVIAEQYRVLATKMQPGSASGSRVMAIMSSAGGEGKTVTAINLALSLSAISSGGVLLVDGDLRRPRIHEYLGLTGAVGKGFGELLADSSSDFRQYVRTFQGISVIPGSSRGSEAVGLLSSAGAREVMAALRREFEFVVLDSPPILPIADSLVLAGLSDEILLVVRARRTPRELFEQAVESLNAPNLRGVVLNDVDYQYSRYAYAYRYYQKNYLAQS